MGFLSSKLRKAKNFSSTAIILLKSYLTTTGWKGYASLVVAAGMGFIQPVPLAFLAHIAMAASKGHATVPLPGGLGVPVHQAFYVAIGLLLLEILITHGMERLVIAQNNLWQQRVHQNILHGAARAARPYFHIHNTGAASAREYVGIVNRAVTSASIFGRIVSRVLKDGTTVLITLAILTWLDVSTLGIMAFIACLIAPFIARASTTMAKSRLVNQNQAREALPHAIQWAESTGLSGTTLPAPVPSSNGRNTVKSAPALQPLFGMPNQIKLQYSKFRALTGLQLVAVLLAIFIWNGASVEHLLQNKLNYLAVLVVFLRSLRSLTSSIALFSQSYTPLATLRTFLSPKLKPIPVGKPALPVRYTITDRAGKKLAIKPGEPVYLLSPGARLGFQLVGLSNALKPMTPANDPAAVWINAYQPGKSAEQASEPPGGTVFAEQDWPAAQRDKTGAGACIFIALAQTDSSVPRDADRPMIVTDGDDILAVGTFAECYDRFADNLTTAKGEKKRKQLEEDESEELDA